MAERNRPGDAGDPADDEVFDDEVVDDDATDDEPVGRGGTAVAERSAKPRKEVRRTGFFGRIGGFFREVVSELRKVIWPTRNQLVTYTIVVLVFVSFMVALVWLLDLVFAQGVTFLFGT